MFGNKKEFSDKKKDYDAASGRPLVRDIIVRAKKEAPPPQAPEPPVEISPTREKPAKKPVAPPSSPLILGAQPLLTKKHPRTGRFLSYAPLYWSLGAVLGFTAAILAVDYFSVAVVLVTPRQEFVEVASDIRASAAGAADLALEVVNFDETLTRTGPVAALKKIEEKAGGRIMIFNEFSSEPQFLVAGTRLEAPNGKIYRIQSELKVPGAKVESGKIQPQGIETDVVADRPGEEYNLGLSDFTIPGFKGTAKFDKFYGRSKTEMTGGFVGTVPVVSEGDVKKLTDGIQEEFSQMLQVRLKSDLPEGVFVPRGAYEISTAVDVVEPPVGARGEQVTVKVKGVLKGLAVKKTDIYKFLGKSYLGLGASEEVDVPNFDELALEISGKDFEGKTLNLNIKGKAHFVWQFDEAELKNDLLEARENRQDVFAKYGAIERAQIDFRPFWWRIFPKDITRVKVEKVLKTQ